MNKPDTIDQDRLDDAIEKLIKEFGMKNVLEALVVAVPQPDGKLYLAELRSNLRHAYEAYERRHQIEELEEQ